MLADCKRRQITGLAAAPLVELQAGSPHSFSWTVVSSKGKSEGVFSEDMGLKWSGRADLLFTDAPRSAVMRFTIDMRTVEWAKNSWASEWQSSEELGGALGAREVKTPKRTKQKTGDTQTLGRFQEAKEEEIRQYGFPDFPVRYLPPLLKPV